MPFAWTQLCPLGGGGVQKLNKINGNNMLASVWGGGGGGPMFFLKHRLTAKGSLHAPFKHRLGNWLRTANSKAMLKSPKRTTWIKKQPSY